MNKRIRDAAKMAAVAGTAAMLTVGLSVFATTIGTNISADGTLTVNGGSTFGDAAADVNLFTGTLQASTTALFTGNITTYGALNTFGDAATDVNLFTGTVNASTTALFDGAITMNGNVTVGNAAADSFTLNAATTTITAGSLSAHAIATSSANIPFLRFDTSTYRIGIGTTSPAVTFSVGGAGHGYLLGGLGVGLATTTAGVITNSGDALFGDAAGDLVMFNAATLVHNNAGTTTIPSANLTAWNIATTTASIPFLRYDTSNYRIGIGTTSPAVTFSVGGGGHGYFLGGLGVGVATTTAGSVQTSGDLQLGGDLSVTDDATITDDAVVTGGLGVGTTATTTNGQLEVSGDGQFGGDLWVADDSKITGGLGVGTTATTTNGSLEVSGVSLFGGVVNLSQSGTSTISINSTTATRGACLQFEGADGASTFRLYATSAQVAMFETGTCQ
ncbi:MAG: hypothetical protein HY471_01565 [Candidatus Sungbacteria bacterium]|nr:hypothetical protein [Candidatus Sungbacteria bacterium]